MFTPKYDSCKQKPVLSVQQMVEMLHNQDRSTSVHNVSRTHNVGSSTVYEWHQRAKNEIL